MSLDLSVKGTAVGSSAAPAPSMPRTLGPKSLLRPVVSAEQAWAMLEEKVQSRYRSVREAFCRWDQNCDGSISDYEFRNALSSMGLELTTTEYKKLWAKFDISGDGKISYYEFNNHVGALIHPRSDLVLNRPETPKVKEWQRRAFARGLKKKMKDIDAAFKEVDTDGSGRVSHQEFIQLLRKLGMAKVGHEESFQMMQKHKHPGNTTGEMTYDEFRECLMEYLKIPVDVEDMPDDPPSMSLQQAEKLLQEKLYNKFSQVQKAFRSMDEDKSGELSYDEFRRALRSMGVTLNDDQFEALVSRFDTSGDGSISYEEFNRVIGPLIHPDAIDSSRAMKEMEEKSGAQAGLTFNPNARMGANLPLDPKTGERMTVKSRAAAVAKRVGLTEAEALLAAHLFGKKEGLMDFFKKYDADHSGELSRYEFSRALAAIKIELSEEDMDNLMRKYDDSSNGKISYAEFSARMGPFLEASAENAARLMLSSEEVKGALGDDAAVAVLSSMPAKSSGGGSGSGVPRRPSTAAASVGGSGAPRMYRAPSIATADMDLSNTENKMRRVLGRSWVNVYKEIKKENGGSAAVLPGDAFRDRMAEKGVPLTSKEVRAIALRYGAEGNVDVEKVMSATFKTGASPSKPTRPASAAPRPAVAAAVRAGAGRPPLGANARPQSAMVRSPGSTMSGSKMLF